jgi:hypothetical protein
MLLMIWANYRPVALHAITWGDLAGRGRGSFLNFRGAARFRWRGYAARHRDAENQKTIAPLKPVAVSAARQGEPGQQILKKPMFFRWINLYLQFEAA